MYNGYPFYGQLAQSVQPNPKCEGCLHYCPQHGQTGVCSIGLRPWTCGDGSTPSTGYAPMVGQMPGAPGDAAPVASADPGVNENAGVETGKVVSLGEEHVPMVKSIIAGMEQRMRESCPLHHQASPYQGQSNLYVMLQQACSCSPVSSFAVAKALMPQLSNLERATLSVEEVVGFINDVRELEKK